jgi:hypothetical protein
MGWYRRGPILDTITVFDFNHLDEVGKDLLLSPYAVTLTRVGFNVTKAIIYYPHNDNLCYPCMFMGYH